MNSQKVRLVITAAFHLISTTSYAQSLASNRTRAEGRYNMEQSFADTHRKTFDITSWAGKSITELLTRWGSYTRKNELPNGMAVYIFEKNYAGSGGSFEAGYVVTDPFGNVLAQKKSKDTRYSYDFTDYYEFYTDKNNTIIHVKTGTR